MQCGSNQLKRYRIMNYEEKYKEALERAKALIETNTSDALFHLKDIESIFPELKESEDERIRKWCISHFKAAVLVTKNNAEYKEYLNNKVIPWLEKQGETYTKKDVDDAWVEGVCYARRELEKQDLQNLANSAKTCKSE